MQYNQWIRRELTRRRSLIGIATATFAALGLMAPAAMAASSTGTSSTSLTAGSLSIGSTTNETISVPVGGIGNGILPSAAWTDSTGSGNGWNGTVGVSDFTYTGAWSQTSGTTTALSSSTSAAYGDTQDGVTYTVTVGSGGSTTSTPYTWTSTDSADKAGGSGTATNGTAASIGTKGITILFASGTTYPSGAVYTIHAGTMPSSALSLDTAASGAAVTAGSGTTSPNPTWVNNATTVTGGGVGPTNYSSTAVKFVSAAVNTGMGTYTVNPGVQVNADPSAWAQTYTAGVQYSIVSGP
jgi:hypothetical protein